MPHQTSQLDPDTYVLMEFNKDHKFARRGGCETVHAKKGEQHHVPEQHVNWLEEMKIAIPVSNVEKITPEDPSPVVDPSNGKVVEEKKLEDGSESSEDNEDEATDTVEAILAIDDFAFRL